MVFHVAVRISPDTNASMNSEKNDRIRSVIEKAIERHGGDVAFSKIDEISIRMKRIGGAIPVVKGLNRTFHLPDRIFIRPHCRSAVFRYDDGDVAFDNGAHQQSERRSKELNVGG